MSESPRNYMETLLAAIGSTEALQEVEGTPLAIVPAGYKVEDLSKYLALPRRKRGIFVMDDAASFCKYVNIHKVVGVSMLYGSQDDAKQSYSIGAVFDDHSEASTGWGQHLSVYRMPFSDEYLAWSKQNGQEMMQQAFAEFIEENLPDIIQPVGAKMMEIARKIKITKNAQYVSETIEANGNVNLIYKEENEQTGTLKLPEDMKIGIPIFRGSKKIPLMAKLRYRLAGQRVVLWYDISRLEQEVAAEFAAVCADVKQATGLELLFGKPGNATT